MYNNKSLCRLCVSSQSEYKSLYDDNGQGNEVYEITLKYFDPILLSPANEQDSKVICLECWHHISEFYGFQQSVLQAQAVLQAQLENDVKQLVPEVKLEEEVLQEPLQIREIATAEIPIFNDSLKNENITSDKHDFGSDYEDDFRDDNPFSTDDDEKPLIEHINRLKNKSKTNKQQNNDKSLETPMAVRKPRKPRSPNKNKKQKETEHTTNRRRKGRPKKLQIEHVEDQINDPNASANEMEDDDGSNSEKKSVKEKTKECDEFIAQWKQELECVCCPTTVANFTLLRKHFRLMHPTEKCYVICCQRKFYHRFHIVEHIRLHINPNAFRCDECGRCSTNSRNLAKHKKEMHTEEGKQRPFECDVCHKKFANKTILRTHMEVHEAGRDYVCSECGKGFPSENRRKIHERMVHQADRVCDQCGKTIHGIYALKLHLMEHAGYKKPKWPCDECNAQLNSHSSLKRHKLIAHHDGSTVYICSECGKVFTSENALRSHKRIVHLIERKFKCNICEKAFKFPKILREHMASHTGEDLYQCPHCPKTFKVSANMHHHRKKVHPKEWAEARINKPVTKKVDIALVSNEIIIKTLISLVCLINKCGKVRKVNMDKSTLCRLCVEICADCKNLYDEDGSSTQVYETTVKYFDPMLLSLELDKSLTVICLPCWRHISDFHEFQQTVYNAQTKLAFDMKQADIKTEDDSLNEHIPLDIVKEDPVESMLIDQSLNVTTEDDKYEISLPEEFYDEPHNSVEFTSDDERPLLECLKKTRKKRTKTKSPNKKEDNGKTPKKRGRKPKCADVNKSSEIDVNSSKNQCDSFPYGDNSQDGHLSSSIGGDTDDNSVGKPPAKNVGRQRRTQEIDEFIAQWKQDLECVVCGQLYPNLTSLRKHFREFHPKQKCYITCCQRKLRHRFHIEEHIRIHLNPDAFKCDVCGKCCTTSRSLNSHKLEKHTAEGQERTFECPICQKRFAKKTVLKCHIETHKTGTDYVCSECGKGFATEQRRKVHERTVHNVDRVCDQCGKTIHGIYALKQHLLEHQGIKKPKWPCDICNAQLYSHSSLKRHKQVAHNDGSTVYVCGECGKIAATETALRSHKKYVHQAERKHKCTICDKAFKVAVVLREHMATHTGEDLYTCPHCPKTFKVSSNMHHHRKKAHPKEWAEGRLNRPTIAKVDINQVSNEVVL
uniref:Uncharacterized protein n=2 Tax=Musca domestica TaxID=7370 RepID=A0A1I8MZK2_MUSDO